MKSLIINQSEFETKWSVNRYLNLPQPPDTELINITEILYINPEKRYLSNNKRTDDMKLIEAKSVDKNTGRIKNPIKIRNKNDLPQRARLIAKPGDILFPTIQSENISPIFIKNNDYIVSDYFAVLVPKYNRMTDPYYLYWALQDDYVKKQVRSYYQGSYGKKINIEEFKKLKIKWLDKTKRKKKSKNVKSFLSALEEKNSELSLKDTIDRIFEDTFEINKGELKSKKSKIASKKLLKKQKTWNIKQLLISKLKENTTHQVRKLNEIAINITMGLQHRNLEKIDKKSLIKGKNIEVMKLKLENKNKSPVHTIEKHQLQNNDIILRVKGKIGPCTLVTKEEEGMHFYNDIAKIKTDKNIVMPQYLSLYLNSFFGDYYLDKYSKNKSMTYLNIKSLNKIPVIIPGTLDQFKIIERFHNEKIIHLINKNNIFN
jgi:restriction endonuclease S subunit